MLLARGFQALGPKLQSSSIRLGRYPSQFIQRISSQMETIKQTAAQNFGGGSHKLVSENQQFDLEQVPSLSGKVAVITGGSEGIIRLNKTANFH